VKPPITQQLSNKILKLLSYRPRSVFEIKFRLKKITDSEKLINTTIKRFIDKDLLNDQEFASWWVDQRTTHRPKGNIALKSELLQKGIDRDIINANLLDSKKEQKLAKKLISSKKITNKKKAYQYLRARGFSSTSIFPAIDELGFEE